MDILKYIRPSTKKAALFLVIICTLTFLPGQDRRDVVVSTMINVTGETLRASPPSANWPSYNGDYSGRRFSELAQITTENVKQLRAQWVFHPGSSNSLEVTPVVVGGVMFVTSANDAFALDARTGRPIWHYQRPVTSGLVDDASAHHNRGVAVWHDRVFMETDNAHLICLDVRSGHQIWDFEYADARKNYGATSAPLVVNDKLIVGTSGGDDAVRGFIAAFDPLTGKLIWRFWTIPGPGEFGNSSWPGKMYLHGGGTTWMPGTFDPELNTLYWGTSNPSPDFDGAPRPGDDLYTDCLLALDPDTGKLKWYFQFTPHDLFDYDAAETAVLIDGPFRGESRKLLVEANRNGFLYVLDRSNGKFLSATPFVEKLNWTKGIDSAGRPLSSGLAPTPAGTTICPGMTGATNWFSPSYNPSTHFFYFMALESCEIFQSKPEPMAMGRGWYATGTKRIPGDAGRKILIAFNLDNGQAAWRYPQVGDGDSWGGTMTTAGGLVFFGDDAGAFEAVDARSGTPLWHFNTGQRLHASPMSYAVNGTQYVAIAAGSDVFSFALPD
ncbi:MAG TPA: PQQ-dependent dehydrogenase, methanol/ethanol family [Terriglobia bacterium]|nr:PQQ-dependent dehydrogenase, methanol/ethanol family [Terriglobia bacterium]